ncbi:hypothetical protein OJAV_G00009490 [Oryzias javanicus]|uniref:Uncharacterized protein n=1 Tax=Oryzias javanicus TaxID=123683 RepID=A0A3S2N986_ORYJA|nr:hypothetical protein OJAV_G00009490 [Oryzias javanicus]
MGLEPRFLADSRCFGINGLPRHPAGDGAAVSAGLFQVPPGPRRAGRPALRSRGDYTRKKPARSPEMKKPGPPQQDDGRSRTGL